MKIFFFFFFFCVQANILGDNWEIEPKFYLLGDNWVMSLNYRTLGEH